MFSPGMKTEKPSELCDTDPLVKIKQSWGKRDQIYSENMLLIVELGRKYKENFRK